MKCILDIVLNDVVGHVANQAYFYHRDEQLVVGDLAKLIKNEYDDDVYKLIYENNFNAFLSAFAKAMELLRNTYGSEMRK